MAEKSVLLKLDNIGKIYDSNDILTIGIRGINLEFDYNEFVTIEGESGSGKSTLLNVIAANDSYEEGELYFNGAETSHYSESDWEKYRERNIAMIFQDFNIIENLTVLENVELALLRLEDKKERRRIAEELIEKVGLTAQKNRRGSKLSGGEKQRTVIARALAKDSPIILADEPTGNLDGFVDMIAELTAKFPLKEERITGEKAQKEFIALFGAVLRMRNLLTAFDDFEGKEILSERDLQDYLGRYQDLRDEWKKKRENEEKEDITDDVVFELELVKQIEINIDYILILVTKYHDSHCNDKETLITIQKSIDASPELRSKKALIENFIDGINDVDDVMAEWHSYIVAEKEKQLNEIIAEEKLKADETKKFMDNAIADGEMRTTGTDIDKLMPPISRFGNTNREKKKQTIIEKLKAFFERFFGV